MGSDEVFESISHPLRIKMLKMLAEKPMSFSELKRELGIKSSGKLDFHLKKLDNLVTLNSDGKYTLTKEGYAALQAIMTVGKYGWQKRAYIIATVASLAVLTWNASKIVLEGARPIYLVTLALVIAWYAFYSYWSIIKRKIFKQF
ncbi:MAG: hypothetical protein DRJ51_08695 [Thermoprotei archaeon]|nr:MAG: hypothetical protein DRJ51_08695 [Thermoprotei archaeon]